MLILFVKIKFKSILIYFIIQKLTQDYLKLKTFQFNLFLKLIRILREVAKTVNQLQKFNDFHNKSIKEIINIYTYIKKKKLLKEIN